MPASARAERPVIASRTKGVASVAREQQHPAIVCEGGDRPSGLHGWHRARSLTASIARRTSRRTSRIRCQRTGREAMAKGQKRSNREHKKPKADKKKAAAATSASTFTTMPPKKKPGSA